MYTRLLRALIKGMRRMAGHCDGSSDGGYAGHCY